MDRINLIQSLIERYRYSSYLEIGIANGDCFNRIDIPFKVSVDPGSSAAPTYSMSSDKYFSIHKQKFDIVFIDGLHHEDQVYRDIVNSLSVLKENGTIVCHDLNPIEEDHQKVPLVVPIWNGDCWKAWVRLRSERDDLEMYVVDTDQGCGIIRRGRQDTINFDHLDWKQLVRKRGYWLNLITVSDFKEIHDLNAIERQRQSEPDPEPLPVPDYGLFPDSIYHSAVDKQITAYEGATNYADLASLFANVNNSVFVRIKDNQPEYYSKETARGLDVNPEHDRLISIARYLDRFLSQYRIEDTAFVFGLHDAASHKRIPLFSFSTKKESKGILFPDICMINEGHYDQVKERLAVLNVRYPWDKKLDIGVFRGSTTGGIYTKDNWMKHSRSLAAKCSLDHPDDLNARLASLCQTENDEVKSTIRNSEYFGQRMSFSDSMRCRYLVCVDGNAFSHARFAHSLLSNCLTMHTKTIYRHWCEGFFEKDKHFVEFEADFSDYVDKIGWIRENPDSVIEMIDASTRMAATVFCEYTSFRYLSNLLNNYTKRLFSNPGHFDVEKLERIYPSIEREKDSNTIHLDPKPHLYLSSIPDATGKGHLISTRKAKYIRANTQGGGTVRCNDAVAAIWQACNGERTVGDIVVALNKTLGLAPDELSGQVAETISCLRDMKLVSVDKPKKVQS